MNTAHARNAAAFDLLKRAEPIHDRDQLLDAAKALYAGLVRLEPQERQDQLAATLEDLAVVALTIAKKARA